MDDRTFIHPHLTKENLDSFYHRDAIFKAINENLPSFRGKLLDVGCGKMPYREYIRAHSKITSYKGLDISTAIVYNEKVQPDFTWDGTTMPFENESYDCAFATEVLEHCPYPNITLNEVYRILKKGSPFFFTVPFVWNLHEVPHDYYRYTPFSLKLHLENAGFRDIKISALGGWHASLAQMAGLWVKRGPMGPRKRKLFSSMIMPLYKKLIRVKFDPADFNGTMITGMAGIAMK